MNKKLFAFILPLILLVTYFIPKVEAESPTPDIGYKENYTPVEVRQLAIYYADKYNVDTQSMLLTIDAESEFKQYAKGDGGKSKGACQIHDSNGIPTADRNNPRFCLDWTAQKIADGQARLWTGYKICVLHEKIYHDGKLLKCNSDGNV